MTFRVERMIAPECGAKCPEIVVADGVIEQGTPTEFIAFVRSAGESRPVHSVVLINSPGGNVVAAMELGIVFRRLRVAAIVAGYASDGAFAGPVGGQCISACVYAFMGAVSRVAPAVSRIALHRMSLPDTQAFNRLQPSAPAVHLADRRLVSLVAGYAKRMGVDPALVWKAESLPVDSPYLLTRRDIARWRLAAARL